MAPPCPAAKVRRRLRALLARPKKPLGVAMPDTSPRIFQYSLRALLGVPVIVALILPPLLMQDRWTLLLSLAV